MSESLKISSDRAISPTVLIDASVNVEKPLDKKTKEVVASVLTSSRASSPVPSERSDQSAKSSGGDVDLESISSNIFGGLEDPEESCREAGYNITDEEWKEIYNAKESELDLMKEDCAMNFAMAKLAMKKLDLKMFWQAVHHLKEEDLEELTEVVKGMNRILKTVYNEVL